MVHRVLTEAAVSISEHKRNPMATVAAGEGMAVAVLNRNEPAFYCVPAKAYEELMDLLEDLELNRMLTLDSGMVTSRSRSVSMSFELARPMQVLQGWLWVE